jgi:hypothetical protein
MGFGVPSMTMPLGIHVPLATKERIWRGEFVELGSLLEGGGAPGWDNATGSGLGAFSISAAVQIC